MILTRRDGADFGRVRGARSSAIALVPPSAMPAMSGASGPGIGRARLAPLIELGENRGVPFAGQRVSGEGEGRAELNHGRQGAGHEA